MATDRPQSAHAEEPGRLAAFQIANFRLLFAGRVTSNLARQLRVVLRGWMALELTNSPFLMALVVSSLSWPMVFMPFIGGVLADRVDRKKILKWTESLLTLLWAFVAMLVFFGAYQIGPSYLRIEWWHFIVTSVVSGIIQSIGRPGHQAMLGSVVDEKRLSSAIALDAVSDTWPRVGGPGLAAPVILLIGGTWHSWAPLLFTVSAIGQFFSVITIFLLRWEPRMDVSKTRQVGSPWEDFVEGMQFIKGNGVLLALVGLGLAFMLFSGGAMFLLPIFARDVLRLGSEQGAAGYFGFQLIQTLGASIGAGLLVMLALFRRRGLLLMGMAAGHAVCMILFSQSTIFMLSAFLILGNSVTQVGFRTIRRMAMQALAPDEMRGRIMSMDVFLQGLGFIGALVWGSIAQLMTNEFGLARGAQHTLLLGATLYGLVTIIFFIFVPILRRFR